MRRSATLLAAFAALAMVLAPAAADARAGSAGSMGSRGSRTYSAPPSTGTSSGSTQPMQRSITPNSPSSPGAAGGMAPAGRPGGLFGGGFGAGLMGGLIGAGIGGMLFGHGMFGGISGIGSFLGLLIQLALLFFIGRWVFRRFFNRQPAMAGGPNTSTFTPNPGAPAMAGNSGGGLGAAPVQVEPADYQAFEGLLQRVQAAWSAQDLNALRAVVTPEMLGYFGEQLADQASRGVRNTVTDVHLQQGDLSEAWAEQGREYATVAMKFSMIDATIDAQNRVVDGSATEHVTATELWTFVRARGGNWILSAIQQGR